MKFNNLRRCWDRNRENGVIKGLSWIRGLGSYNKTITKSNRRSNKSVNKYWNYSDSWRNTSRSNKNKGKKYNY